jgi:hypothetical protein
MSRGDMGLDRCARDLLNYYDPRCELREYYNMSDEEYLHALFQDNEELEEE